MPSAGTNTATVNLIGTGTTLGFGPAVRTLSFPRHRRGGRKCLLNKRFDPRCCHSNVCREQHLFRNDHYWLTMHPRDRRHYQRPRQLYGCGIARESISGHALRKRNDRPQRERNVTVGRNLAPGPASGIGTLHVNTSGTGGVIFGDGSIFKVEVGSMGVSDRLAIAGGSITLTSSTDTLSLSSLAGAFDGLDYTLATFTQNVGGGTFNTVQGLPSNYTVEYNPTSIRLVAMQQPLLLTSAVSRKVHGSAGPFDINLLLGVPVECRSTNGNHTLVFTFTNYLTSGTVEITAGIGTIVGTPVFSGKTVTVDLTGVADAQTLVITLRDVTDRFSQVLPNSAFSVGFLKGDTNGDRFVNAGDAQQTRSRSGQLTNTTNFRSDVNLDGFIASGDATIVRNASGGFVP